MRYGFASRLRACAVVLAVAGASSLMLAGGASAATFNVSNTTQLEEAVSKANGNAQANTIVLASGAYLPETTLAFTDTSGVQTVEASPGSPSLEGPNTKLEGSNVQPYPSELFVVSPGVSVIFKYVEISHAGGGVAPAISDASKTGTSTGGTVTIENSLVAGNTGPGVLVESGATATVRNSTLSNGLAAGLIDDGTASFFNATVAFNEGGGLENKGTLNLTNTIVAENEGGDCTGKATTTDHSLDSDGSCGVGALSKMNPKLGPLINDGGTTSAHFLQAGSPAIGAADASTCTTIDQRGATRITPCSIGAVELAEPIFNAHFGAGGETLEGHLAEPEAVAVGLDGNIWVADSGHDRVLEFTSKHEYLRQFGSEGSGEGQFRGIRGIATNKEGDLYVSDYGNDRVQEFSPTGVFIRKFGSLGTGAGQLAGPTGIAVDSSGDVWVLNTYGVLVQEFSATGGYMSGFGTAVAFSADPGIAISGGNLYITEAGNAKVHEYSTTGTSIATFDERGTGTGKSSMPWAIATDPTTGNLYVSDIGNNNVQEFSAAGSYITTFGSAGYGAGQLSDPKGLAVGPTGVVYVADTGNQRVEVWAAPKSVGEPPTFSASFGPGGEALEGRFAEPEAVGVDSSGNIWVADSGHDRVLEFNSARKFLRQFGSEGTGEGQFEGIRGIATNKEGDVYVSDYGNDRIQEFSSTGVFIRKFGSLGTGAGQLAGPTGIAVDSSGDVWVLNTYGVLAQEFSSTGGYMSGFGTAVAFSADPGIAISGGNLYITEAGNAKVHEYSTTGTSIATFDERGTGAGKSSRPWAIATDPTTGNLYVSDAGNNNVQEFSPTGSYVAAFASAGYGADQLSDPKGLAVGPTGVVYVADTGNNSIEELTTP